MDIENHRNQRTGSSGCTSLDARMQEIEQKEGALLWGIFCHISAAIGLLGVPFGNVIGPLLVWLAKRKEHPFVDWQGKEALNFQVSMTIYALAAMALITALGGMDVEGAFIAVNLALVLVASFRAGEGRPFRYPLAIRFIK